MYLGNALSIRHWGRATFCGVMLAAFAWTAGGVEPLVFHVAPDGDDAWSGELSTPAEDGTDGPWATPVGARDGVRERRAEWEEARPVEVYFQDGVYAVEEAIRFGPEDTGSLNGPVTYKAVEGADVVISGGRTIGGWEADGDLWRVDLPAVASGDWYFSDLYVDGERCTRARKPNDGYYRLAGLAPPEPRPDDPSPWVRDHPDDPEGVMSHTAFAFEPGHISHWDNLDDALLIVFHAWEMSSHRIAEIDGEANIVHVANPSNRAFGHWEHDQRYIVENVFEALDSPGEWYLDRGEGVLYYMPMPGERLEDFEAVAPVAEQLLVFEGDPEAEAFIEHLHFEGLRFHHTDYSIGPEGDMGRQAARDLPGTIQANGLRHSSFRDCEIANVGTYGMWLEAGCQHNRIERCEVRALGAGGVRIGTMHTPNSDAEWSRHNIIDNNFIHDGGNYFAQAVGVWIGRATWNTVSHNVIRDFFYTGVSVGWSWGYQESSANHNIIEYNHIHDIGKEVLSDMGGIYTLGVSPGTVLRNNHIHDVRSDMYGSWGIYPDEGTSHMLVENNVVYNCKTGGFHQHYGEDNHIRNNIFAFGETAQLERTRPEDHRSFTFERNIVYYNDGPLLGINWSGTNYVMDHNLYWRADGGEITFEGHTLAEWRERGMDINSKIADPGFADPDNYVFTLSEDSPAFALGFKPIDVDKTGLYGPETWVNRPDEALAERPLKAGY